MLLDVADQVERGRGGEQNRRERGREGRNAGHGRRARGADGAVEFGAIPARDPDRAGRRRRGGVRGDDRVLAAPAPPPTAPPAPPDPAALLDDLMTARGPGLRLYARQFLAGRADAAGAADDAVQTAFVRLARRLARDPGRPDSGPPPDPAGWLFKTVRNLCKDRRRDAARRHRRESAAANRDWFLPDPAAALDAAAAAEALAGLPADLREPVALHLWGDRTFDQIAELLNVSRSAAHRRYARGLDLLRQRLGE